MMQLNIGDHASVIPFFHPIPPGFLWQFQWARKQAFWIAANKPNADPYFSTLGDNKTLSDLLQDSDIWVNYSDAAELTEGNLGESFHDAKELTITNDSVAIGQWTVLATLIHELAHLAGAPGRPSRAAEDALIPCGLGYVSEQTSSTDDPFTPYDPNAAG